MIQNLPPSVVLNSKKNKLISSTINNGTLRFIRNPLTSSMISGSFTSKINVNTGKNSP